MRSTLPVANSRNASAKSALRHGLSCVAIVAASGNAATKSSNPCGVNTTQPWC